VRLKSGHRYVERRSPPLRQTKRTSAGHPMMNGEMQASKISKQRKWGPAVMLRSGLFKERQALSAR
jgi:hypothetical protein